MSISESIGPGFQEARVVASPVGPASTRLFDSRALADVLGVSERHLRKLHASGKLPAPIRLGRCLRWSRQLIDEWISRGCPARDQDAAARTKRGSL